MYDIIDNLADKLEDLIVNMKANPAQLQMEDDYELAATFTNVSDN
jgi:hypothetical protein